jgi:calcineurin-like phosphoesterase family protein
MIFYISDTHFGHANIIKLCNRPFADVDEMNEVLITKWNTTVTNQDTVYICGDLIFRSATDPDMFLGRLKGKKHLIIGNHDQSWMSKVVLNRYFESVDNLKIIAAPEGKITLCHYPMMSYGGRYHIFGHIHNNKSDTYWSLLRSMNNAMNASVEINNYEPVIFEELVRNNEVAKAI